MPAKTRKEKQEVAEQKKGPSAEQQPLAPMPVLSTARGRIPLGRIVWVDCPLFPDPQLQVGICVSNPRGLLAQQWPDLTEAQQLCRRLALMAPLCRNFDFIDRYTGERVPEPNPADPDTYLPLVLDDNDLGELGIWIFEQAYPQAIEQTVKN